MRNTIFAALLNGAILSALATVLIWLSMRIAPRRALNAATRYLVWWATLAVAVTLPLAFLPADSVQWMRGTAVSTAAPDTGVAAPERVYPRLPATAPLPIGATPSSRQPWFPIEMYDGRWPDWI